MPSIEKHAEISKKRTNQSYREIIDKNLTYFGAKK
jgi:hypothetical protein